MISLIVNVRLKLIMLLKIFILRLQIIEVQCMLISNIIYMLILLCCIKINIINHGKV